MIGVDLPVVFPDLDFDLDPFLDVDLDFERSFSASKSLLIDTNEDSDLGIGEVIDPCLSFFLSLSCVSFPVDEV
jgi:hypothetical protein